MNIFDQYILHIFVFSPLIASVFIMLIPAGDLGSKLAASKFFAILGFLTYARLLIFFLDQTIATEVILSLGSAYFRVNITLFVSKFNVIIYGITSLVLLCNIFTLNINDTKTNIHHVTPFLLMFVIHISLSQNDLRVALPILSIANFLVYFIIGSFDKIRRGFTVFQMGIFIFSCDALALVLLQIPQNNFPDSIQPIFFALILLPGLARLCMPMLAPFTKKLFFNTDNAEGSFLIVFEHLAGFFVLNLVKMDLDIIPRSLFIFILLSTTLGIIYIGLSAIIDKKISIMPHYFLTYYSSITITAMFISNDDTLVSGMMSLYSVNILCFFLSSRFFDFYIHNPLQDTLANRIFYLLGASMLIGIPSVGVGSSFWYLIGKFMLGTSSLKPLWIMVMVVCIWLLVLMLLGIAMLLSFNNYYQLDTPKSTPSSLYHIPSYILFSPILIMITSWFIPWGIFFLAAQGL